jgi:hypothetical protein
VGGLLTENSVWSWRSLYYYQLALGLFYGTPLMKGKRGVAECLVRNLIIRSIYFRAGPVAVMLGFSHFPIYRCVAYPGRITGLYLFFRWEDRTISPILYVTCSGATGLSLRLTWFYNYLQQYLAVAFMLNLYLQYIKASAGQAGSL